MLVVRIIDSTVATKSGTGTASGKPYTMRTQTGVAVFGQMHMVPINITLDRDQAGYQTGDYVLDSSSFTVGKYGDLMIGRLKLAAVPVPARSATPAPGQRAA